MPPFNSTTTTHESTDINRTAVASSLKPPLPSLRPRTAQSPNNAEVLVPPLVAGAIVASFAAALADGLNNELLTHYYLPEQKVRVNIDRVLDRLLLEFTKHLWDELWHFYCSANPESTDQIKLLFNGPICQLTLILNGPEVSRCILDKLGPGLSRRSASWSLSAGGIDLQLALQLLCGYWNREHAAQPPRGSPDEIARSLHKYIATGNSAKSLISKIRETLVSPHYVQMHLMESAVWDILLKRPFPPSRDGFHVIQFKFECSLFGPLDGIGDPQLVKLGSLPTITGTANDYVHSTMSEYVNHQWSKCGSLVLRCIEEAFNNASTSSSQGDAFTGMSLWDGEDNNDVFCSSLRLLHVEVENGAISISVSAWTHTMIEVLQQMAWTCAALSAAPFPGISDCVTEISDWDYLSESVFVSCKLTHRPISNGDGSPWLRELEGAAIANGFPIRHQT